MSNTFTSKVSGRMSSRGWAIALGIGAIALAAILLIVYLDRYRARVGGENAPTPVLVAKQLIPKGTPGTSSRASHVRAHDAPAQGGRGRGDRRPVVPGRPRRGDGHLPGPAVHLDRLRRVRHGVGRLADHRRRARDLGVGRQRPRQPLAAPGRTTVDIYTGVAGSREALPAERQGARSPGVPGPSGGGNLVLRIDDRGCGPSSPTRPTTRSSTSSCARSSARSPRSHGQANSATVLR